MKELSLENIHQIGRVGHVLSVIFAAITWILMIMLIATTVMIHNVPVSLAKVDVDAAITVNMDLTEADLESSAVKTLQSYLTAGVGNAGISILGIDLVLSNYDENSVGGVGTFGGVVSQFSIQSLWKLTLLGAIALGITCALLIVAAIYTHEIKSAKNPFDSEIGKKGTIFSISLVAWGILIAVFRAIATGMFTGEMKIGTDGIVLIVLTLIVFLMIRLINNLISFHNS